jgi:hypothetical protein
MLVEDGSAAAARVAPKNVTHHTKNATARKAPPAMMYMIRRISFPHRNYSPKIPFSLLQPDAAHDGSVAGPDISEISLAAWQTLANATLATPT